MDIGQSLLIFICGLIPLAVGAWYLGQRRAQSTIRQGVPMHSLPRQYGAYVASWMVSAAVAVAVLALAAGALGLAVPSTPFVLALSLAAAAVGLGWSLRRVKPGLRARNAVERLTVGLLFVASLISVLTTIGIIMSILFEALRFFDQVSFWNFITGTEWRPVPVYGADQGAAIESKFGAVPLFVGTFVITVVAMLVAIPVGLYAAIFMSEYASLGVRRITKPLLEMLAGIPTVVYGFFAAITVSPLVVQTAALFGLDAAYTNGLAAGLVMGIMIIPFVSSLSDDVINSIPNNLREGSYAMGATQAETIQKIVLPAAFPGIMAAVLLAVSKAMGETMIVLMAAGIRPNLTLNPLESMTTVTVHIVDALTGDQAFNTPETLSAFALGLVLFVFTLALNTISVLIIRKFRQNYE